MGRPVGRVKDHRHPDILGSETTLDLPGTGIARRSRSASPASPSPRSRPARRSRRSDSTASVSSRRRGGTWGGTTTGSTSFHRARPPRPAPRPSSSAGPPPPRSRARRRCSSCSSSGTRNRTRSSRGRGRRSPSSPTRLSLRVDRRGAPHPGRVERGLDRPHRDRDRDRGRDPARDLHGDVGRRVPEAVTGASGVPRRDDGDRPPAGTTSRRGGGRPPGLGNLGRPGA